MTDLFNLCNSLVCWFMMTVSKYKRDGKINSSKDQMYDELGAQVID